MRTIVFGVLILLVAVSTNAGLIVVQDEEQVFGGRTQKAKVTLRIEGKKLRWDRDVPQFAISAIHDQETGKSVTLMHFNKTYIEPSASQVKEGTELAIDSMRATGRIPAKLPQLRATGRKDVISGWKAEEYVAETEFLKATYWIAAELHTLKKYFLMAKNPRFEEFNKQFPDLEQVRGIPVLTVLEQEIPGGGKTKTTTKVLSIHEKDIPDSEFAIPPGYKNSQVPSRPVRVP